MLDSACVYIEDRIFYLTYMFAADAYHTDINDTFGRKRHSPCGLSSAAL